MISRLHGESASHVHELSGDLPKKHVMGPVHALARVVLHPKVYFEEGAKEELDEHFENGGSLQILMSHFRRWETVMMADVANERPLQPLRCRTGITARRSLFDLPFPLGYIVRNSGAQKVDRPTENKDETPEQKAARREANQQTQAAGARFLANGHHWLIFPEGGSRQEVEENGEIVRKHREPDVLLPLRNGFVYTLEAMTPEERKKVKLLGIVAHYGARRLPSLRPTIHVGQPVSPVEGSRDELLQQGTDLLQHGLEEALRLDALRR